MTSRPQQQADCALYGFASDNTSTAHPAMVAAIADANRGPALAYGQDPWTARAHELLREHFGADAQPYLVFNGTGANVLCLRAMTRSHEAVLCARTAHINVAECGAPERIAGVKLIDVPSPDGKLTPATLEQIATNPGDSHRLHPRVVSISQATELGTSYQPHELRALAAWAHARGMLLHVDGARLANAAAGLQLPLRALTTDVGVDAVSFGATKNGLLYGDAVVLLRPELADGFECLRKQSLQLASKMRYLAAQMVALLVDDLWYRCAEHANAMAKRLAVAIGDLPGLTVSQAVETNAVFALLSEEAMRRLRRQFEYAIWSETAAQARWMCSWDTTPGAVDALAGALAATLAAGSHSAAGAKDRDNSEVRTSRTTILEEQVSKPRSST